MSAAQAAPLPFAITSLRAGDTVLIGSSPVAGTGQPGQSIDVTLDGAASPIGYATVNDDGSWNANVFVRASAVGPHTLTATTEGTPAESTQVAVVVSATATSQRLVVTSPADHARVPSRTVTFTGTAPAGSRVLPSGDELGAVAEIAVGSAGTWSFTATFPVLSQNAVLTSTEVTFGGPDSDGTVFVPRLVTVALPAAAPAPVIVSPAAGATVATPAGSHVSVSGTATGGPAVAVFFLPVDAAAKAYANQQPGSIEATGIVVAGGAWTATTPLAPGVWTADAELLSAADAHASTTQILSLPSAARQFTLVAGAAVPPSSAPTPTPSASASPSDPTATGTATSGELAFTGSSPALPVAAGVLLLLAGFALVFLRRRARVRS
ncbi:hypothetical protein GCM10025867_41340 [Frondihabitans sucicola]|uniref:Gram-positive cocci surface proteins LPxTG domain-containing protein n=1 Tax=Frondihabitans sucicola TaxID=1268041 RepID=A0ABM8GTV5_9MICO|nr:hypothetical protein GCM10025867_41340 [Frondihabitans sucicola]